MKKIFFMFSLLVLLSGCGGKRIDASSAARLKQSAQAIADTLPPDKRREFGAALARITMHETFAVMRSDTPTSAELDRRLKKLLHGRTAEEIIAEANNLQ